MQNRIVPVAASDHAAVVRITVRGGVAFVDDVPPSVAVEVKDYDVCPQWAENDQDENGVPCSIYRVDARDLANFAQFASQSALLAKAWIESMPQQGIDDSSMAAPECACPSTVQPVAQPLREQLA